MPRNAYIDPGLRSFIEKAGRYPLLTQEREREVAIAWHDRRDRSARDELAHSHLRLVVKIACGFTGYRLPLEDLVGEGNLGLLRAIDNFDPEYGVRFSSYAIWWIRSAIQAYVLRSWSLVKMGTTVAQRRLFFNLRRLKMEVQNSDRDNLTPEAVSEIARKLQVHASDVAEMDMRLNAADNSLNTPANDSGNEWLDLVADDAPDQETTLGDADQQSYRRAMVARAINALRPREREVILERRFKENPVTFEELSHRYAVTCERVRQIEIKAIEKLRGAVARNCRKQASARASDPLPAANTRGRSRGWAA